MVKKSPFLAGQGSIEFLAALGVGLVSFLFFFHFLFALGKNTLCALQMHDALQSALFQIPTKFSTVLSGPSPVVESRTHSALVTHRCTPGQSKRSIEGAYLESRRD